MTTDANAGGTGGPPFSDNLVDFTTDEDRLLRLRTDSGENVQILGEPISDTSDSEGENVEGSQDDRFRRPLSNVKEESVEEVEDPSEYPSPNVSANRELFQRGASSQGRPSLSHSLNLKSELKSDRPYSGKLSVSDAFEEGETLEDFEEQEREIARQLSESMGSKEEHNSEAQESLYIPESVQNRQSITRGEEEIEDEFSTQEGYPLNYSGPPPAYSSSRAESGYRRRKENGTELAMEQDQSSPHSNGQSANGTVGYEVPPPHEFRRDSVGKVGVARDDYSQEESNRHLIGGVPVILMKQSENCVLIFCGMAAAVAGNHGTAITNKPNSPTKSRRQSSTPSTSSSEDIDDYIDNIRDQAESPPKPPLVTKETLLGRANTKDEYHFERAESIVSPKLEINEFERSESRYQISDELKDIFGLIEEFQAEKYEIEPVLKPFLLDYIPSVGDVDPFIKIPRPDDTDDNLGLIVLDEPATIQSDSALVDLRLHQLSKTSSSSADLPVKKLSRADKNTHQIDKWIENVKELRKMKPPDRVHYSKHMPDIDRLMEEWNPEVEQCLKDITLFNSKLDVPLEEYVDLCLAVADIPIYKNRIQSLHLLFSLYSEFKHSQHFRNLANGFYEEEGQTAPNDRLEL
ncbi:intraflagellar transport protein 46 like protein [Ditylenchus destructor]|nr:intraflagellar transport protein 46 like protein [Ditylenchus destructor]